MLWSRYHLHILDPLLKLLAQWPVENHWINIKHRNSTKLHQRLGVVVSELAEAADEIITAYEYDPNFKKQRNPQSKKKVEGKTDIQEAVEKWGRKRSKSKTGILKLDSTSSYKI